MLHFFLEPKNKTKRWQLETKTALTFKVVSLQNKFFFYKNYNIVSSRLIFVWKTFAIQNTGNFAPIGNFPIQNFFCTSFFMDSQNIQKP